MRTAFAFLAVVSLTTAVLGKRLDDVISLRMPFTEAQEVLVRHHAEPTILQIEYPPLDSNRRIEVFILKDGRTIDFTLARPNATAPWIISGISEVTWVKPERDREKKWIPLKRLVLPPEETQVTLESEKHQPTFVPTAGSH